MFGIGEAEFAIIVIFGFLLFGPDRLPSMGRTIGRALKQFRTAQEGFTKVVQTEIVDPMNAAVGDEHESTIEDELDAAASDADLDDEDLATRPKKESFAERKARLEAQRKAERAAKEAAASDTDTDTIADAETDSDSDAEQTSSYVPNRLAVDSDDDLVENALKEEDINSANDLYTRTKKRTRAQKVSATKATSKKKAASVSTEAASTKKSSTKAASTKKTASSKTRKGEGTSQA